MRYQAPRGTQDVLPGESSKWQRLESIARDLLHRYGYQEIRTPTFEETDLFVRSSGETSEIVTKQMYSFVDKGGRSITLKPEGTAPVMRSVIENSLCPPGTVSRLYYITPVFRYERPQKGRLREPHQVGMELIGSASPAADAEIMEATVRFFNEIGIADAEVQLNSIGREECRTRYREAILAHMEGYLKSQGEEDWERARRNPLRLLDSKDPDVQAALQGLPPILDYLEDECKARLDKIERLLADAQIPYRVVPGIVRGLDYYTETVFEIHSPKLGAQSTLCGGGRYDDLIKDLGGPSTPSVGVGIGIERALLVLESLEHPYVAPHVDVFVVLATPEAEAACFRLARELRDAGVSVIQDLDAKSMKSQLRQADRVGARTALILGSDELAKGTVTVRNLKTSEQSEVPLERVREAV
ncbi:MAG TPA: histidine--tRNA ligase [Fimbriimonas sp.]